MAGDAQRATRAGGGAFAALGRVRPKEEFGDDRLVVETGVDPVTSRFSGARSTN